MQINNQDLHFARMFELFKRFVPLSQSEFEKWKPYFQVRKFDKKTVFLQEQQVENYLHFVSAGLVRKFMKVKKGELTMQIAPEGHVIHGEFSFHSRNPSNVIVEAIEPCILISISYNDLQNLYRDFPLAEKMGRKFVTEMFIIKDRKYYELLKKTTREIFIDYVRSHPEMMQRVSQKYIASYLNIKPETFSRLKHLLKKKVV